MISRLLWYFDFSYFGNFCSHLCPPQINLKTMYQLSQRFQNINAQCGANIFNRNIKFHAQWKVSPAPFPPTYHVWSTNRYSRLPLSGMELSARHAYWRRMQNITFYIPYETANKDARERLCQRLFPTASRRCHRCFLVRHTTLTYFLFKRPLRDGRRGRYNV